MQTKDHTHLPETPINRFTDQFIWFTKIQAMAAAFLLFATIVALVLSNSSFAEGFLGIWETQIGFHIGSFDMSRSLQAWINDGVMTLFSLSLLLSLSENLFWENCETGGWQPFLLLAQSAVWFFRRCVI
jgi:NhaA family Na+:H+ antiporter